MYVIQHCFICHSTVSEDAGIEPRTVATLASTARPLPTRLDLIRKLDLIHNINNMKNKIFKLLFYLESFLAAN